MCLSIHSQEKKEHKYVFKDIDGKVISQEAFEEKYKDTITYNREYTMTRENGTSVFTLQPKSVGELNQKFTEAFIEKFSFKEMPEFNFTDLTGNSYTKENLKGKKWCLTLVLPNVLHVLRKYRN